MTVSHKYSAQRFACAHFRVNTITNHNSAGPLGVHNRLAEAVESALRSGSTVASEV